MYCPKCGQQQVSSDVRFCPRCGFQLEGVRAFVTGEAVPTPLLALPEPQGDSPRKRGVKHGVMLMLSTALLVPLIAILARTGAVPREYVALAAIFCSVGGFLRLVYALLFQSAHAPAQEALPQAAYVPPPQHLRGAPAHTLPPAQHAPPVANFGGRLFDTSELGRHAAATPQPHQQPPSVTESETRLLEEK
ncbi:MAG TPA: zinc ribbon domain-containing protein [Pyrinomonadaceae bacterium]|nr:zinc ribbon domain-containing protein [Pyrinomonadaceae bacterium]